MPVYRVVSGDYSTTIQRMSHQQAATDAIGLLRNGKFDEIRLGLMTVVTLDGDEEEDSLFFSTLWLVRKHGLIYYQVQEN